MLDLQIPRHPSSETLSKSDSKVERPKLFKIQEQHGHSIIPKIASYYGRFRGLSQLDYWLKFLPELMNVCLGPNHKGNMENMKNVLLKYLIFASQHPAMLIWAKNHLLANRAHFQRAWLQDLTSICSWTILLGHQMTCNHSKRQFKDVPRLCFYRQKSWALKRWFIQDHDI